MLETQNYNCYEYFKANTEPFVKEYGDYHAAISFGRKIRRSEIIHDIDCLAAYFKSAGLRRGDVYTIFLPTCLQSFIAFYALNKIGVIANIVHPLTPADLLKEKMDSVGSKGIMLMDILAKSYVDMLNFHNFPCVVCSAADYSNKAITPAMKIYGNVSGHAAANIKNAMTYRAALKRCAPSDGIKDNGSDIAVYLHGGGTTGKSKTIKLTSKNLNELAYKTGHVKHSNTPGVQCAMIVLPLFHAFGLGVSMHFAMCEGFCCIPIAKFNPRSANALIRKYPVSFIVGVPNMYKKMLEESNFEGKHLRNLELMFSGGDVVSEHFIGVFNSTIEKWGGKGRLFRGYGLTEVSSVCCANTYEAWKKDSIGKPFYELKMQIWDENKKQLPPNTIGEIVVSGTTVMEGYYDEPTSGVYTDENGERWVLSGDLGYVDEDGFFYFTGRKKRLIIISGYNVFPTDIEEELIGKFGISEICAVQGYKGQKPIVKLYVSLSDTPEDKNARISEIYDYCNDNLPRFSRPSKIVILDSLPRTQIGKIDFMKLCDPAPTSNKDKTEDNPEVK